MERVQSSWMVSNTTWPEASACHPGGERHVGVAGVVDDVDLEGVVRCLVGRLLFVWPRSLAATMAGAVGDRFLSVYPSSLFVEGFTLGLFVEIEVGRCSRCRGLRSVWWR